MAKTMVHHGQQVLPQQGRFRVAIDLTASIGGMTLALAKTNKFEQVIAIEIDEGRAELCRQNMVQHGMQELVEIRTMDAMDAIPTLPSNSCISIDPPWGGVRYKQNKRSGLEMGKWSLEDVLERISIHLRPCVVGLRMPVTFVVDDLLPTLREDRGMVLETLSVRKLSVQLFVVLFFPSLTES
jgi:hypothetical protein